MLDTNIFIYLLKGSSKSLVDRLANEEYGDVLMSCLTLAELRRGVSRQSGLARENDESALKILQQDIIAVDFDASAAEAFGALGANFELKRNRAIDNLIAAHAISRQAVLVTNNEKDFKGYPGLEVENWV